MCSKYVNHSKLNSQHDWRDLHDHLKSMRIFTLRMTKIFVTIYLEGLANMAASNWLTSMEENNP